MSNFRDAVDDVRADASDPDWASNGWISYRTLRGGRTASEPVVSQIAVRAPGLTSRESVLTRETSAITAVRFAG